MQLGRLVQPNRIRLPAPKRGHRAAYIPGHRLDFLQRNHIGLPVARRLRQRLEVELVVARNHGQANPLAVSAYRKRLEYLLCGKPDLRRHRLGGKIVRIDVVLADLIANPELIQDTRCIGFGGHYWDNSSVTVALAALILFAPQFQWPEAREERRPGSEIRYIRNVNGQEVPLESKEEKVLESSTARKVVERTSVKYDPSGRPGQPEIERIETQRDGDTEKVTSTVTRRDVNGNAFVAEVSRTATRKTGDGTVTRTETERPTQNGRLEMVQIQEIRTSRPSPDSSSQTAILFNRDANGRFVETGRTVTELRKLPGGEVTISESRYAGSGMSQRLIKKEVRRIAGNRAEVDVYEANAPGRVGTGEPQLVRQQTIEKSTSGGQTVETTTVRNATPDGRLGPPRPADRRVCQGDCQ